MKVYRPNSESPNFGKTVYTESSDKEALVSFKKDFVFLKEYEKGNIPSSLSNSDFVFNAYYRLTGFIIHLYKGGGVYCYRIRHYFNLEEMLELANLMVGKEEMLGLQQSNLFGEFKEKVEKCLVIKDLKADFVDYLAECLSKEDIIPYVSFNNNSESVYFKPDGILESIRISDHLSHTYRGLYSVVCCSSAREIPFEARVSFRDGGKGSVYVSKENYRSVVRELAGEFKAIKYKRVLNTSKFMYKVKQKSKIEATIDFSRNFLFEVYHRD